MTREAALKKSQISVLPHIGAPAQRPDYRVESAGSTVGPVGDDRALHRDPNAKRDDSAAAGARRLSHRHT
eukprot:5442646-Prymnesium_polylepis.1